MSGDDYGFLGRDLVVAYNQTVDRFVKGLEEGHKQINTAATVLNTVATGYENVDASYYEKFGYLAQ